jgi:hypothetical protein
MIRALAVVSIIVAMGGPALPKLGIEPKNGSPEEFAAIVAEEVPKWTEMVRITGIKLAE